MIKKDSPEGQFLLVIWRTMFGMAGAVSEQYRSMLIGIAAILAVIVANLQSIREVVQHAFLKSSLYLLIASLFCVSVAYMLSLALKTRYEVGRKLEENLGSPAGKGILEQMEIDSNELRLALCQPFFGPLGWFMKKSFAKGTLDPFAPERGSIRLLLWQTYAMWVGLILAAIGLITITVGLN